MALEMQPAVLRPTPVPIRSHLHDHKSNLFETDDDYRLQCEHQDTRPCQRGVCQEQRRYGCNQTLDGLVKVGGEANSFVIVDPTATSIHPEVNVFNLLLLEDQPQSSVQD
jgi:hypothetical protein